MKPHPAWPSITPSPEASILLQTTLGLQFGEEIEGNYTTAWNFKFVSSVSQRINIFIFAGKFYVSIQEPEVVSVSMVQFPKE